MSIGIAYGKIVRLFDDGGDVSEVQGVLVDLVNAEIAAERKRDEKLAAKIISLCTLMLDDLKKEGHADFVTVRRLRKLIKQWEEAGGA